MEAQNGIKEKYCQPGAGQGTDGDRRRLRKPLAFTKKQPKEKHKNRKNEEVKS